MKIKIFSVIADEDFRAIYVGEGARAMPANGYLEQQIQSFLDEHPRIAVRHL